jgi:Ca-activated chloride channel family protein
MSQETGMKTRDGEPVSLKSVHIDAEIRGLMLNVTTQQHYVNKSRRNLEIVYTFPLPAHAVILGLELQIGEKTLRGVVMEKSKAEENYEEAVHKGDLPVMVEHSGPGLYTANLGNLKRGQSVIIKVEWAQLLSVRDGCVRVAVPTVVGQRFGDAHAQGALAAHQTDESSLLVEYPLSFRLAIRGELANARVSCPSHWTQTSTNDSEKEASKVVTLDAGAAMDRDIIITLSDLKRYEFFTSEMNPDGTVTALASFYPNVPKQSAPLALKILVDCSGSMEGESIAQAQEAVHQVMQQLGEGDYVSYSRFGSQVVHNFGELHTYDSDTPTQPEFMLPVTDKKLANIGRLIHKTQASMGGTQMRAALLSTINQVVLSDPLSFDEFVPCLLLITDGNIWDHSGVIGAARASGLRIFTIGVGSAPAESLLRELTEATGGICEFVTPNESMARVALRLVQTMRSAQPAKLHVSWPNDATQISALQSTIFNSDTIHSLATLKTPPSEMPALRIDTPFGTTSTVRYPIQTKPKADPTPAGASEQATYGPLARIFAHSRMQSETEKDALQTALTYNLVSFQTNLLLVYTRESKDKATELPSLEQIKQMHAAGHSGIGIAKSEVMACRLVDFHVLDSMHAPYNQPAVWRNPGKTKIAFSEQLSESSFNEASIPAFLRRQASNDLVQEPHPSALTRAFNEYALRHDADNSAFDNVLSMIVGTVAGEIIKVLNKQLPSAADALTVLLSWIGEYKGLSGCDLQRHARRLVNDRLKALDQDEVWDAFKLLDQQLPSIAGEVWNAENLLAA